MGRRRSVSGLRGGSLERWCPGKGCRLAFTSCHRRKGNPHSAACKRTVALAPRAPTLTVDILYVAWNRLEYVKATWDALIKNTDWTQVAVLHVHDDGSTDGTREYLTEAIRAAPCATKFESIRLGGPVAATNRHLDLCKETPEVGAFVKLDSDFVVPPGWLGELTRVARHDPGCDIIGMQPRFGPPTHGSTDRTIEQARHIGGIGFMRYRTFEVCRPTPNGRYGWSEFQTRHSDSRKGWITPDLAGFCLDLIDLEPWKSLQAGYVAKGWAREWPMYADGGKDYYEWWMS